MIVDEVHTRDVFIDFVLYAICWTRCGAGGRLPPANRRLPDPLPAANRAVVGWAGRQLAPGGAGPGAWPKGLSHAQGRRDQRVLLRVHMLVMDEAHERYIYVDMLL